MDKLIDIFERANKEFLKKEEKLILSDVHETTLCGSLKDYLAKKIKKSDYKKYYVDIEYNRNKGKLKTIINNNFEVVSIKCDLIVHSRGEIIEQDNLIAIEMKKSTAHSREKEKDKQRLIALTKDSFDNVWSFDVKSLPEHVCRYKLGIYYEVNIRRRKVHIQYYRQGTLVDEYDVDF